MHSTFFLNPRQLSVVLVTTALLHPASHAQPSLHVSSKVDSPRENTAPHSPLEFDQVIARVPREHAPLASVALARIQIALYEARGKAAQTLCSGHWTPRGPVYRQRGPYPADHTPAGNEPPNWVYQSLREPLAIQCGRITRAELFLEISRHLPDWILIRPAGQTIAYHRGKAVPADQTAMVAFLR